MYIGQRKIKETTPGLNDTVVVSYESTDYTEIYPTVMFEAMQTEGPQDDTQLRDLRVMAVMQKYVDLLLQYDLSFKEIDELNSYTQNFLAEKKQFATAKVLGSYMRNKLPDNLHPQRTLDALTVGDIDRILENEKFPTTTETKAS